MILIEGQRLICDICSQKVTKDEVLFFPNFEANSLSPLAIFNDAIAHKICFDKHPLKDAVLRRLKKLESLKKRSQKDFITGEPLDMDHIEHPDNQVNVFFLTDDESSPLYSYNGIALNQRNLEKWVQYPEFLKLLNDLNNSANWGGNAIGLLIAQLTSPVKESYSKEFLEKMNKRYPNKKA